MESANAKRKFLGIDMPEEISKWNFCTIFFLSFSALLIVAIMTVIRPIFLEEVLSITKREVGRVNGFLAAIGATISILLGGLIGAFSDRIGRKNIIISGYLISSVFISIFGFSKAIGVFFNLPPLAIASLATAAISIGGISHMITTSILLADYTNITSRGKAFAISGIFSSIGTFTSHLGVSQLPKYMDVEYVYLLSSGIALATMFLAMLGLKEIVKIKGERKKINWKAVFESLKNSPGLRLCYAGAFVGKVDNAILATFTMVWVVMAASDFGLTRAQATAHGGITLAIFSLIGIVTKPFWGIVADRWGRMPALSLSLFCGGLGYFIVGLSINNPFSLAMRLAIALCGFGAAGDGIATSSLTVDLAPKKNLGAIMGGASVMTALAMVLLIPLGGFLFDLGGRSSPFILIGIADWLVLSFAFLVWKKVPKHRLEPVVD